MKFVLTAIILFSLLDCSNNTTNITSKNISEKGSKIIIDTAPFNYHFKILDSAANANFNDTVYCCTASIKFMEVNTGINSQSDGTTFGKLLFYKSDLQRWHEWYNKVRTK